MYRDRDMWSTPTCSICIVPHKHTLFLTYIHTQTRASSQCDKIMMLFDFWPGGREGEEGQDNNAGRNDRRDREDPGGGSVSSHRHTGNCDSLIIIDYQAKMTLIITIT